MAILNDEYWKIRFEQLYEAQLSQEDEFLERIKDMYMEAISNIEKDITKWYMRLKINNDVSLRAAKMLLKNNELEEFKWTLKQYIKRAKENGITNDWTKQLENASAKFHISRLEAIKLQIQEHLEYLYGNYLDGMYEAMQDTYKDTYYKTAYELQTGFNMGFEIVKIDTKTLEKILAKPWAVDELNFSDRIWKDKNKLINTLQNTLVQSLIRGTPQDKVVKEFAKKMNVSLSQAKRLISTEMTYFNSISRHNTMEKLGVEKYEIIINFATVCKKCISYDGKIFNKSDYLPSVTAPPFHPNCHCRDIPFIDMKKGLRAIKGKNGKTYYIDGNMKYNDWKEVFVDKTKTYKDWQKENKDSNVIHKIVDGEAVADKWKRRKNLFENQIDDVVNYQGFDGLPRIVYSKDEFLKLVNDDHFIGKRVYTAKTLKQLDEYIYDLRYGKWYIDCRVGKAQYGKGMYCATDYTKGNYFSGLDKEMEHYIQLGKSNGNNFKKIEIITLDKTAKIFTIPDKDYVSKSDLIIEIAKQYVKKYPSWFGLSTNYTREEYNKKYEAYANKIFKNKYDIGSMVALLGYDVINVAGHGESNSYTVILNRTKLIIFEGDINED